jgi:DNA polymerase III delta prime subunit
MGMPPASPMVGPRENIRGVREKLGGLPAVLLAGWPGPGKSTVVRLLARELHVALIARSEREKGCHACTLAGYPTLHLFLLRTPESIPG